MHDVTNIFSDRLKRLRGDKSLQEVADALGISRVSLGYYETGKRMPDIDVLCKIAKYYEVSSDYLIGLSDAKTYNMDIQGLVAKTGLSEKVVKEFFIDHYWPEEIIVSLDKLLQCYEFPLMLGEIPSYMDLIKKVDNTSIQFEQAIKEAQCYEFDDYSRENIYNVGEKKSEAMDSLFLKEYTLERYFRNIIQHLGHLAEVENRANRIGL